MSPELTTLCLIALGVGFMILLAGFLMIRVMRGSVFGLGMMLMRVMTESKEDTSSTVRSQAADEPAYIPTDLHSRAQSLDFDAAVAKYRQQQQTPPAPPAAPFNGYPPSAPPSEPEDQGGGGWPR